MAHRLVALQQLTIEITSTNWINAVVGVDGMC